MEQNRCLDFKDMSFATGKALAALHIPIVPIVHGTKAPKLNGWPNLAEGDVSESTVKKWIKYYNDCGWGIVCGTRYIGIDIDEENKRISNFIRQIAFSHFGPTISRIGRYPRQMLPYRVKGGQIASTKFGNVQIMGKGSQFVGYGIHPSTNKPYWWTDSLGMGLLNSDVKIPSITASSVSTYTSLMKNFYKTDFFERVASITNDLWELFLMCAVKGKRSDRQHVAILKLNGTGFSHDEIYWLIWSHPNGIGQKAHERGEKWLRDRIEKESTDKISFVNSKSANMLIRLDQVEEKQLDWLWYPFFLKGAATFLDGIPGGGKSNFMKKVCHHIADGLAMPNDVSVQQHKIIYYTAEEDASFVKMQLRIMGCKNLHNIYICPTPLKLDTEFDVEKIENDIRSIRPGLVIFDIFMSYLSGKVDSHMSNKVAEPMAALKTLAQKYDVSLALLRHTAKQENAIDAYKGQGSASLIGLARVGLLFWDDKMDSDRKIVTFSKANYSPKDMQLDFFLKKHIIENSSPRQTIAMPEWGTWTKRENTEGTATNLNKEKNQKFSLALKQKIADGGGIIPSKKLDFLTRELGVSSPTAFRISRKLGFLKTKIGSAFYTGNKDALMHAKKKYEILKR